LERNLFREKIESLRKPQVGFLDLILGKKHDPLLRIVPLIPEFEYVRAQIFLESVNRKFRRSQLKLLQVQNLLLLLYAELLNCVEERRSVQFFYERLRPILSYLQEAFTIPELVPTSPGILNRIERKVPCYEVPIRIRESYVLRGEVLLRELAVFSPTFRISVDELISVLLIDFVRKLATSNPKKFEDHIFDLCRPILLR